MRKELLASLKQIASFIVQGIDLDSDRRRAFELELNELIVPHMAVLVHRRKKLIENSGHERWSDELDDFLRHCLWPLLGADLDYAERNRTFVTLIVDIAIERAQARVEQEYAVVIPLVSRFDATWAN